jgi:hypothetical protein
MSSARDDKRHIILQRHPAVRDCPAPRSMKAPRFDAMSGNSGGNPAPSHRVGKLHRLIVPGVLVRKRVNAARAEFRHVADVWSPVHEPRYFRI